MAFESLSEKLQNVFKNLRGKGRLTEDDVRAGLKEVRLALLEAHLLNHGGHIQKSRLILRHYLERYV